MKGDESLGTCFLFQNGNASAKHCFENAREISIQGVSKDDLGNSIFYVHENEMMDLIYIEKKNSTGGSITYAEEAKIEQVSANTKVIWIKENLLLIIAKIKGRNSGRPVISKNGSVVGVAVNK